MKILLTGAVGMLGRAFCELAGDAHDIVRMDIDPSVEATGGVCASVTDADAVMAAAEGCDAIVHTASMHGGQYGEASNAEFIQTNVLGAENVFAAAMAHGVKRFVFSSSFQLYTGFDWQASGAIEVDENMPPKPDWAYPLTKQMCEQLGAFYARNHGLEFVSLRYVAISQRSVHGIGYGLLARVITARDAAAANLLALTRPGLTHEVLHIGPDTPIRQGDINKAMKNPDAVLEHHWPGCTDVLQQHGMKVKSNMFWPVTRIDRARAVLGYDPESRFDACLRKLGWTGAPAAALA